MIVTANMKVTITFGGPQRLAIGSMFRILLTLTAIGTTPGCLARSPALLPELDQVSEPAGDPAAGLRGGLESEPASERVSTSVLEPGQWGLGLVAFAYQAPLKDAGGEEGLFPFFYYQGERLSSDLQQVSYRLNDSESFAFSVLGQLRSQGYEPERGGTLDGMADRDPSIDVGFLCQWIGDTGTIELSGVVDVSGKHDGQEWAAGYSMPLLFPGWLVVPSVGVRWQDADLADYYYGVRSSEALPGRPAHRVGSGLRSYAEVSAFYEWTQDVSVIIGASHSFLGDDVGDSPIVEHDYESSAFLGLLFEF